jgi:hypothetical protein
MNESGQGDGAAKHPPAEASIDISAVETSALERIVPRLLRNMIVAAVVFLVPAFWFYRWAGSIGYAFGAGVSYVNFRSLTRGVEGLADRIVNRDSREKGGRILFRFIVRYALVGAVAYAIFKGSSLAFRGFLWGLCLPAAALMIEAVWEGFEVLRRRQ